MKAVLFHSHGGPEVLEYSDFPEPQPGAGQVLVQLEAAALNRLDLWVRNWLARHQAGIPPHPRRGWGRAGGGAGRWGDPVAGGRPGGDQLQPGLRGVPGLPGRQG